jgi:hypothetical protein
VPLFPTFQLPSLESFNPRDLTGQEGGLAPAASAQAAFKIQIFEYPQKFGWLDRTFFSRPPG